MKPTIGSIVHVHLDRLDHCVPALVTNTGKEGLNLQLFFDGPNDATSYVPDMANGHDWRAGVIEGDADNTWHLPES